MASKLGAFILLFSLFTISLIINTSQADISVYWGQQTNEGTLHEACATGNYEIVILSHLLVYDDGRTPLLNLAGHCGGADDPCSDLETDIQYCQSQNIKVFLSTRIQPTISSRRHSIVSAEDPAKNVADYLLENYLSGNQNGPLGSVALDGIDIFHVASGPNLRWDELVKAISASTTERKIYLSAAPQCPYPDLFLNDAIKTGLFDYIWVIFFQNSPCEYSNGNPRRLFRAWKTWTSSVLPNNTVFLGIPASPDAASSGYIPPEVLKSDILPTIRQASNYGGVMLWDRYFDKQSGYSGQIKEENVAKSKVCKCICNGDASANFYGLLTRAM